MALASRQKKLLFLSSLGGVLEFYDFIIYALMATYISNAFFPTGNGVTSLIGTYATFSIGYLARPLGGIIFGHFGDKIGRKSTFSFSILMMATATFGIGLVPSYQQIGLWAPVMLTIFRICQGLSIGGEIPGAIAYVSESMPVHKGFACGVIFFAINCGIVLGAFMNAILNTLLTDTQMYSWGWRLPFFLGGLFGFLSYRLRTQLDESLLFKKIEHRVERFPILVVFRKKWLNSIAGIFIVGLGASIITLLFLYIPSYLTTILHIEAESFVWTNALAILISALLCIVFGSVADHVNHKVMMLSLIFLTLITASPIFIIYAYHFTYLLLALLMSTVLNGIAWGVIPTLLTELYPTEIRYSGVAITYNLAFAIFGGLTPLIATLLIYQTGSVIAPIYYLIATALLALIALGFIQRSKLY